MIVLVFKNGTFEIVPEDKIEFKVESLVKNDVRTIFSSNKKKNIERFLEAVSDKGQYID